CPGRAGVPGRSTGARCEDRVLATRFGWHAVEAAHRGEFGKMTALRGTDIVMVPLGEAVETLKTVPAERYAEAECVL
ncbi:hypothetical protein ACWDPP_37065, partial [Streptomyces sp. NPDC000851]